MDGRLNGTPSPVLCSTLPKRERKKAMDRFLDMDVAGLIARVKPVTEKHMRLTDAIGSLLQDFNMVCPPLPPRKTCTFQHSLPSGCAAQQTHLAFCALYGYMLQHAACC